VNAKIQNVKVIMFITKDICYLENFLINIEPRIKNQESRIRIASVLGSLLRANALK